MRTEILDQDADQGRWPRTGTSVPEICELFWAVEKKHNLPAVDVSGVPLWPLVRMSLYYAITQEVGLFDAPHPSPASTRSAKYRKASFEYVAKHLRLSQQVLKDRVSRQSRYTVLGNGRRIKGVEPYIEALLSEIGAHSLLIEPRAAESAYRNAWDYHRLARSFRKKRAAEDPNAVAAKALYQDIELEFRRALGLQAPILKNVASMFSNFVDEKSGFSYLLERNSTEQLFLLNAYTRSAMVAAAKALGCGVVELQHGFISRYHLGYSWPGRSRIATAPDELWCFGPGWCSSVELAEGVKTRSIGAPYLEISIAKSASKDEGLVVFTSQGVLGRDLLPIAIEVAARRPDLSIVFRLHPSESLEAYERELAGRTAPHNFSLSHRNPSIFDLLARARFQVGGFSTTLIEGMALGVAPIVLRLPGHEYMADIVEAGDAQFAEDVEGILAALNKQSSDKLNFRRYYDVPASHLM